MAKKAISEVLPNLTARPEGESVLPVRARPGVAYHTLILDTSDTTDVNLLMQEGWIQSYVVLPKLDGPDDGYGSPTVSGYYISACVDKQQIIGMSETNQLYRLAERSSIKAAVLDDFPSWAKTADGYGPAHVFLGISVPKDDVVDGYGV